MEATNSSFSVFYVDSHISDYHTDMDWLSYLTITILAAIVALTFYSTIRRFINKKGQQKQIIL